jgi:hypothetical protein
VAFCFIETEETSGRDESQPERLKPQGNSAADGTTEVVAFSIYTLSPRDGGRGLAAELVDDCGYVVFLEEADGGYAGCARLEAGLGVLEGYASEG